MNIKILVCVLFFIALSTQRPCWRDSSYAWHCESWEELKTGNFSNFKNLELSMSNTKFQLLDEEFFTHEKFNSLEEITSSGGNITFQEGVFRRLENLQKVLIYFVENKFVLKEGIFDNTGINHIALYDSITGIEPGSFKNMPNARHIFIGRNHFKTIKKGIFTNTNFHFVNLVANGIEEIEEGAFTGMKNLRYLNLEKHLLKSFDVEKILGKTLSLHNLIVSHNKLTKVPEKMMESAPNLKVFKGSHNAIESLQEGDFQNIDKLLKIDISHNKLKIIPESIFPEKNIIRHFYFHSNNLQFLSPKLLEKLANLEEISFVNNDWRCPCLSELNSWITKSKVINVCEKEDLRCDLESMETCKYELQEIQVHYRSSINCVLSIL